MFAASSFVPLLITILFSSLESETATTAFSTKPSIQSYAVEGMDLTLEWTYTLDGSVGFAQFFNVSVNGSELIGKRFGPGNITTNSKYQARFRAQATNTRAELTIRLVERSDESTYRVNVAPTGVGSLAHDVRVTVQYQPIIAFISPNQTVNDSTLVWLDCEADSVPKATITWTRLSTNRTVGRPFNITGKQDQGIYRCTANNGIGNPATANVIVIVQSYRPFNTNFSTNLTRAASLNETFHLMCSAVANPAAEYRLYKEDEIVEKITGGSQNIGLYASSVCERVQQVVYKCIPFNSFGDGPLQTLNITMRYPVEARDSGENFTVDGGEAKRFTCPVDGNPEPNIEWYSEKTGRKISSGKELEARETGCYTCVASNSLGTPVNITQCLIVVDRNLPPTTVASQRSTRALSITKSTSSEREGTSATSTAKSTSAKQEVSAGPPWVIIVPVTGGVVVLSIAVGVLTWRLHKRRECRKDTRSKDQRLLASRRQQSCLCWPTYKRVVSNV